MVVKSAKWDCEFQGFRFWGNVRTYALEVEVVLQNYILQLVLYILLTIKRSVHLAKPFLLVASASSCIYGGCFCI